MNLPDAVAEALERELTRWDAGVTKAMVRAYRRYGELDEVEDVTVRDELL